jgi:hypothetical protein
VTVASTSSAIASSITFFTASKAAAPPIAETFPCTSLETSTSLRSTTSTVPYWNFASDTFWIGLILRSALAILTACSIAEASPVTRGRHLS